MVFGTPSAQVRIPVGDLISPRFCSNYTTCGKVIRRRRKNYKGASADGRWRKNYPAAEYLFRAGAGGPKI